MAFIPRRYMLRFDGSSRNPGPSGIGYTLSLEGSRREGQGLSARPDGGVINNTAGDPIPAPGRKLGLREAIEHANQKFGDALARLDDPPWTGFAVDNVTYAVPALPLVAVGAQIGDATNNETEYQALIAGLRHAIRLGIWRLDIESDSLLVVMQVKGAWKVKDKWLKRLHAEVMALLALLPGYSITHIPREDNTVCDALSRTSAWTEPPLPDPLPVAGRNRSLHEWQAAFVFQNWRAGIRNSYFWGRIFDVDATLIEHVGNGETYKDAKFVGLPEWSHEPFAEAPAIIENLT